MGVSDTTHAPSQTNSHGGAFVVCGCYGFDDHEGARTMLVIIATDLKKV